jgi:hypothetical protein
VDDEARQELDEARREGCDGRVHSRDVFTPFGWPCSRAKANCREQAKWQTEVQEDREAMFALGHSFWHGLNVENASELDIENASAKAVELWIRAATLGHDGAQKKLAALYISGVIIQRNQTKAAELWRQLADQGHHFAACQLAYCYDEGEGVEQNYEKTVALFRRAADQGHTEAEYELAHYYWEGTGVQQDIEEAVVLLRRAACKGHVEAEHYLVDAESQLVG